MAPTSKSAPSNSKGVNPAPNYIASMNSIQLLLGAKAALADSLFGSSSKTPANSQSNDNKTSSSFGSDAPQRQAQAGAEAAELEQYARFGDENMGLGMITVDSAKTAKEKDNRMLRGKLLGKRKVEETALRRREESSDEEEGRSGLGKAKRRKARRDVGEGARADNTGALFVGAPIPIDVADDGTDQPEVKDLTQPGDDAEHAGEKDGQKVEETSPRDEDGAVSQCGQEVDSNKKRKKKKKKTKSLTTGANPE